MFLPPVAAYILFILLTILLCTLLIWGFYKLSKNTVLLGLVAGITAGILCWSYFTVVVIEYSGGKEVKTRIAIAASEYKTKDGQTVILKQNGSKDVFIVNETDDVLALQREHYGYSPDRDPLPPEIIHSHSALLTKHVPDFYPWEDPTETILVDKSIEGEGEVRIWLRIESHEAR